MGCVCVGGGGGGVEFACDEEERRGLSTITGLDWPFQDQFYPLMASHPGTYGLELD